MNMDLTSVENKKTEAAEISEQTENLKKLWYIEKAHPWALKRAQLRFQIPWLQEFIQRYVGSRAHLLDVGSGGGILANTLGAAGHDVTGVDLHFQNVKVAEATDQTNRVKYIHMDSYHLPFPQECFDVVTSMDLFCQVPEPRQILQEISRVLRPGGLFFFHAFNRNIFSYLAVVKGTEWFVKNTSKETHQYAQFMDPIDFEEMLEEEGFELMHLKGLRPAIHWSVLKTIWTGEVADDFKFKWSSDYSLSYAGCAKKLRAN